MGRRIWDAMCFLKEKYSTFKEAEWEADRIYEEKGINLKIYKCPFCKCYHLTKGKRKCN